KSSAALSWQPCRRAQRERRRRWIGSLFDLGMTRFAGLPQIGEKRQHVSAEPSDLGVALFVGTDHIEQHVSHAGCVKGTDALRHSLWRTERGVALGGTTEIHGIALAQGDRRSLESLLIGSSKPGEQQKTGAETGERAARGSTGDLLHRGNVHVRRYDIGEPTIAESTGPPKRAVGAAAAPDGRSAWLPGRGLHRHALESRVTSSVVVCRCATPQFPHHPNRFAQTRAALFERYAADLVLLRKLAANANAKDQAAFCQ